MTFRLDTQESIPDMLERAKVARTRDLKNAIMLYDGKSGPTGKMVNHLKIVVASREPWYKSINFWMLVFAIIAAVAGVVAVKPIVF
jgi:hypothetical protein